MIILRHFIIRFASQLKTDSKLKLNEELGF